MTHEPMTTTAIVKNLAYIPALFFAGLSGEAHIILAVLMVVDTLFGVIRVGVVYGWEHIRSYRLSAGVLSKLTVLGVPLFIALAGKGAGLDFLFLAQATLGLLCLAQLYSILGNVYSIRVGRDTKEFDAVAWILHRVQIAIEKVLKDDVQANYAETDPQFACKIKDEKGRALPENKE